MTPRWKFTEMMRPSKVNIFIPGLILTRTVNSDAYATGPGISRTRARIVLPSDIDKFIIVIVDARSSQLRRELSCAPQST